MRDLKLALLFYTRIPVSSVKDWRPEDANHSMRCFSLVGWIVGTICWAAYFAGQWAFSQSIAVILSLGAGVLATGCFHEDGFADMVDGFGGGTSRQKILDIMKDSRIGSYGTVATLLMYALKIASLLAIVSSSAMDCWWKTLLVFITCHSSARCLAGTMTFISKYSRDDGTSKVKPVENETGVREAAGLWSFGIVPFALSSIFLDIRCLYMLIPLVAALLFFKYFFEKGINGYTGDCLGALEQVSEIIVLLSFVIILR